MLARLFGISTDALLGADAARNREEIDRALEHNGSLHREGRIEDSILFLREKLREFPDSADITYQLAYSLNKRANTLPRGEEQNGITDEVMTLSERAARLDGGKTWIAPACRQLLCLCNIRLGNRERALEIADSMPTWWVSREYLCTYAMSVEDAAKQRQHNLLSLMDMMILHLHNIARDMATDEQSIEVLDKAVALAELITGSDHKFYSERICKCYLWKARYYCRMRNADGAFEALEKALYHADSFERRPERSKYEAFWLWRIEDDRAAVSKDEPETLYSHLLRKLTEPTFEFIRSDPRFAALTGRLTECSAR